MFDKIMQHLVQLLHFYYNNNYLFYIMKNESEYFFYLLIYFYLFLNIVNSDSENLIFLIT